MNGIWKKLLSLFLALTLALQLLPVQAMATELQESESLTVEDQETTVTEDATIVAEVPSGRDEFQKEFILSNGLRMISINGSAVHYQEDGEWKEIDNTLLPISTTGAVLTGRAAQTSTVAYKNTAGIWDVKLPASLNSGSAVEVSKDGYTLSFQFAGEIHNNHMIMSVGDETETANVEVPTAEHDAVAEADLSAEPEAVTDGNEVANEELTPEMPAVSEEPSELPATAEQEATAPSEEGSDAGNETPAANEPAEPSAEPSEEPTSLPSNTVTESVDQTMGSIEADQTAATVTTQVNMTRAQVLDLSSSAAVLPQQEYTDKLYSAVAYNDIYSNTDLRYDLQSNQLKESVIIKQAKDTLAGYKYTLSAPGMVLELQEDNSILAYAADAEEGDEPIFYMPAPFLVDDNLAYNDNINVSLQQSGDTYTLTYSLPRAWLLEEERAYPVVLDPVVQPKSGIYTISDQTVFSNKSMSYTWACLGVGHSTTYKSIARALLKFDNLPVLTSADVIVDSQIYVQKCNSSSSAPMEVHAIKIPWESSTVKWADMSARNKNGNWDTTVEDYQLVSSSGTYAWDVTNIAQQWYASGVNTGMLFCLPEDLENSSSNTFREFYSSDWGGSRVPQLTITYLNNCGLEDYWDYTSQSAGPAGTGYVSNFTGNLVWIHSGLSFAGNRMPVSISHVYNANDKSNNNYGMGFGWRTNYNQRVYSWTSPGNNPTTYYVWEDQDGTRKYFKYSSSGKYENEIDNTLVLTTTGSGDEKYCITDKNGNKSYFDAEGRLKKICNNQQTVSSINISYSGSTNRITSVTDGAGRVYAFNYNTSNLLSSIVFKGTGTTELSTLTYTYDNNSNLTGVTYPDGESVAYGYTTNHLLTSAADVDGYRVEYTYTAASPHRVTHIAEFDGNESGGTLSIEYAHNQTTFVDHNGNKEIVQFNNFGSTVSIQDDQGRAQFAQYKSNSEIKGASQLSLSSKLQNTVVDLMRNGGFETNGYWTTFSESAATGSAGYTTAQTYLGAKAMQITREDAATGYHVYSAADSVYTAKPGNPYTLSAYVKTTGMDGSGNGAKIALKLSDSGDIVATSEAIKVNNDWTRLEVTYNHPADAAEDLLVVMLYNESVGTAYFDCVQLEQSASASRYNLVENGDFSRLKTTETDAYNWLEGSECYGTENRILYTGDSDDPNVEVTAAPQMDNYVYTVTGSPTLQKRTYQDLMVSGSEGDVYTLAGWAKGDSVPLKDGTGRRFGLILRFYNGSTQKETLISFNPDTDSAQSWQYTAGRIVAPIDYTYIRVLVVYEDNMNTVYFDGIQLFKEEFGQSYDYDANGNVVSVIDLQQQRTKYEYADNQLTKAVLPNGEIEEYTYYQDENGKNTPLVKTATTKTGVVSSFEYDDYGNNTKVTVTADGKTLTSTAEYTDNGDQLVSVTDPLGKTTSYNYNTDTGLLISTQAAHEEPIPAGETAPTTTYSYDSLYRTSGVTQGSSTVGYTYAADLLSTITSASGTVYNFTYGDFDLLQSVNIGDRTLISHEYSGDSNRYLTKSTYGNNDFISYTYDNYGRTTGKTYEDGDKISYAYDNNGNLGLVTDSASGRTTKYLYDFQDRLSRYEETGTGYSSSVEWSYDTKNNLASQSHTLNGTEYVTNYTYDADNQLTGTAQGNVVGAYTYDKFGRMTDIVSKNAGTPVVSTSIEFTDPTSSTTSSQVSSWINTAGSTATTYTYTYDDRGNILTISDNTNTTRYTYDDLDQLIREDNQAAGKTWVYTYAQQGENEGELKNGGNITSKKEYAYTTGALGTAESEIVYQYTDSAWKDLLTVYDGETIYYDTLGNLEQGGGIDYLWEHGRQLVGLQTEHNRVHFTYNADGMRIGKLVEHASGAEDTIYQYHYVGDTLAGMTCDADELYFTYDVLGPSAVIHTNSSGSTTYYYTRNAQGDITGIVNASGTQVVAYTYDAWGNSLTITGELATTLGTLNPLRYRGYVYDTETGLYYLQSRYYNPAWGRFINADNESVLSASPNSATWDKNLFAYCDNNPVSRKDDGGAIWHVVIGAAVGGLVSGGMSALTNYLSGQQMDWGQIAIDTFFGAMGGILTATGAGFATSVALDALENYTSQVYQIQSGARTEISYGYMLTSVTIGAGFSKYGDKVVDVGLEALGSARDQASRNAARYASKASSKAAVGESSSYYARRATSQNKLFRQLSMKYTAAQTAITSFVSSLNIFN